MKYLVFLCVFLSACSGSSAPEPQPTPAPAPTPTPVCYLTDGNGNILTDDKGNRLTCN